MGHKFGEAFFNDMVDRGRRELGGLMFDGSSIAQPMYPLRGNYMPVKQADGPEPAKDVALEDIQPNEILLRDDPGKDLGMDRD